MRWDDVNLDAGVIAIKFTKIKEDRYIPIHPKLKELLINIKK